MEENMRRIWFAVAVVACAVGLLAASSAASAENAPSAEPNTALAGSCVANFVCIWSQINYEGAIEYYECAKLGTYSTPFGNPYRSAKNRCGSKYIILNTAWGPVCMAPGGDRPSPGYFTSLTFLNWGDTC
jgi:hypothetical protein